MTISNKMKVAAAAAAIAGGAALFGPAAMAQAQPQGIIGSDSVTLINPTPEDIAIFEQFGFRQDNGDGQFTFVLPGGGAAGGPTWYDVIQANADLFRSIGVETGNETPPYGGVSA
ncbi:hypothetical protein ACN27E_12870 [Mycobacterium sp. WMMD1722]|uniref:hypothetical protein n=1 Tax=Mycobacterium sp. WMMD1722 TaxID=3404117 RepID=UPI003BF50D1A